MNTSHNSMMPTLEKFVLRGDVVMSENLLSFDTAAGEMLGVASLNDRCKDALCHYELAWPPGERPTRPQWTDAALRTLKALGYKDHQYMMVNKVHPETLRATTPHQSHTLLHTAARQLETKYNWTHTPGLARWDADTEQAVPTSRSERNASRSARQHPTGAAAQFEHYQDQESFQSYVRREVAPSVSKLLARRNATWEDLHLLLTKAHLRLEKGETGGYTVLAIDHNIRVKASDVLRNNFAGKINRQTTESALGAWTPASTSGYEAAQHIVRTPVRNSALREDRKAKRLSDRVSLMADYNQYRNRQREVCKGLTTQGREARQHVIMNLRQRKKEIRTLALPWPAKKILLSEAVAASVIELRTLKLSTQKSRQAQFPKNLRTWVAERAAEGDARAAAQLRGWRYADQRNQRRLEATLEANALHLGPAMDEGKTDWSEFMEQRLAAQQRAENLAGQIATARIWTINRTTGDVSYTLNGKLSVIDRGFDGILNITILRAPIRAQVHGLACPVGSIGADAAAESGGIDLVESQKHRAVAQDSHDDGVITSGVRHGDRMLCLGQVDENHVVRRE
jgi:hypothetical protein